MPRNLREPSERHVGACAFLVPRDLPCIPPRDMASQRPIDRTGTPRPGSRPTLPSCFRPLGAGRGSTGGGRRLRKCDVHGGTQDRRLSLHRVLRELLPLRIIRRQLACSTLGLQLRRPHTCLDFTNLPSRLQSRGVRRLPIHQRQPYSVADEPAEADRAVKVAKRFGERLDFRCLGTRPCGLRRAAQAPWWRAR